MVVDGARLFTMITFRLLFHIGLPFYRHGQISQRNKNVNNLLNWQEEEQLPLWSARRMRHETDLDRELQQMEKVEGPAVLNGKCAFISVMNTGSDIGLCLPFWVSYPRYLTGFTLNPRNWSVIRVWCSSLLHLPQWKHPSSLFLCLWHVTNIYQDLHC